MKNKTLSIALFMFGVCFTHASYAQDVPVKEPDSADETIKSFNGGVRELGNSIYYKVLNTFDNAPKQVKQTTDETDKGLNQNESAVPAPASSADDPNR